MAPSVTLRYGVDFQSRGNKVLVMGIYEVRVRLHVEKP